MPMRPQEPPGGGMLHAEQVSCSAQHRGGGLRYQLLDLRTGHLLKALCRPGEAAIHGPRRIGSWGWVERHPAEGAELDLDPGMTILEPDRVHACDTIVLAGQIADGDPRRQINGARHHSHGRGELSAIPSRALKEEAF